MNKIDYDKIYKAKASELDMFKFIEYNRNVKKISELKKLIEKDGCKIPIMVNQNLEVLDGQHRLTVCRELNYPIRYFYEYTENENETISLVRNINKNRNDWKIKDHVESFAKSGIESYQYLQHLVEIYNFPIQDTLVVIARLSGYKNLSGKYKEEVLSGEFTMNNETFIMVATFFEIFNDFTEYIDYRRSKKLLVRTIAKLYHHPKFNIKHLQTIILQYGYTDRLEIICSGSAINMTKVIIELHNRNLKRKEQIKYEIIGNQFRFLDIEEI